MNGLVSIAIQTRLWAESEVFRGMGSAFRGRRAVLTRSDALVWVGIVLAVVVAFVVLSRLMMRQERRRRYHSPRALFKQLCKAHNIQRAERSLLLKLAQFRQVELPTQLFFESQHFDPQTLDNRFHDDLPRLAELRTTLFGEAQEPAAG